MEWRRKHFSALSECTGMYANRIKLFNATDNNIQMFECQEKRKFRSTYSCNGIVDFFCHFPLTKQYFRVIIFKALTTK